MNTQIEPYNPQAIMQGVKDRIKATFVNLIPDEQWEEMVKKEVDDFFLATKTTEENSWGNKYQKHSTFGKMVEYELQAECKKRLMDYLASPDFEQKWENNGQVIMSETVKNMVIENSGAIIANFFGNMLSTAFSSLRYQIQQQMGIKPY